MKLQSAQDLSDLTLKVMSIIAIILGGWWAYYQFDISRATASNIQVAVTSESKNYDESSCILLIHVKVKNIGKVLVKPNKDGFIVSVRRIPKNLNQGPIELEKMPLMHRVNLLKRYRDGYELEPEVEYDEIVALIVPKSSMYAVKATFNLSDETEVDQTAVANVE